MRTALVTGASSGIGLATAKALRDKGFRVIGTSRNPDAIERLDGVEYLPLDLADYASVEACAAAAGPVDVLINNAGESQSGPIEELPMEAIERLFRINVFGAVRLTQLLTPGMRDRGHGRVVMVGSMLASFPLAYRGSYVAAKAAIRGFADAARGELSPFGVWVTTVEPGSIATGIGERRTKYLAASSPHATDVATMLEHLDANERNGIKPGKVAATILQAVEADRPRPLYAVGSRAPLVFALKRVLPHTAVEKIVAKAHGLAR